MKTMKKTLALFLAIVFCFIAAGCSMVDKATVNTDGTVDTYTKIEVSEPDLQKIEIIMASEMGYIDIGTSNLEGVNPDIAAILQAQTIEEVFDNFREAAVKETRDDVLWYVFETSQKYDNTDKFMASLMLDKQTSCLTTTDFWCYGGYLAMDSSFAAMLLEYDIQCSITQTMTMPHKITRTNATKVDDYTVKLNNKTFFYIITEASTAEWTKAVDVEKELKAMVKENVKPPKVTGLKLEYNSRKGIKISWDKSAVMGYYSTKEYYIQRKVEGGKWRNIDWCYGSTSTVDYSYTPGKTYYYRVREIVDLWDFVSYGEYSNEKSIKTTNLYAKQTVTLKAGEKSFKVGVKKGYKNLSGYEIKYSTKKNMKNAKTVTVKKMPTTIKNLKSGTKYYVKIRRFQKFAGKNNYGPYSKKVAVTAK